MNEQPSTTPTHPTPYGYRVWHFALAVPAIAVTLQLLLGSLAPLPQEQPSVLQNEDIFSLPSNVSVSLPPTKPDAAELPIRPLNLRGKMTGPLLSSVLQQYFPASTVDQASDLRDSLPPGDNPRMIVIVPDDDEPVF